MLKTWKQRLCFAALLGGSFTVGCLDFGTALENCKTNDRCAVVTTCEIEDENDQPDDGFKDLNCDGVDGIANQGLFVDPVGGSDTNPGNKDLPLKTIRAALELLRADAGSGITALYLAQGTYDEDQLVLDKPVSLYGAYGGLSRNWQRKEEYITHLDGGASGFVVSGLGDDAGVRMEWLTITSANPTNPGTPSIAMRVLGTQGLRLNNTTLVAGKGAPGAPGSDGADGGNGPDGGSGSDAVQASGGGGGQSPTHLCRSEDRSGGDGQSGRLYTAGATGYAGQPDPPGTPGGDGGTAGIVAGTGPYTCGGGAGQEGYPGAHGAGGDAGTGGMGMGRLLAGMWLANQSGSTGEPGAAGAGGGGGGSGGGCPQPPGITGDTAKGGGSGAGGGGGCGGTEGQGGGGGGASIALLLSDATVSFGKVTLVTKGGGLGGQGGNGGPGGVGGLGGLGGQGGEINDARVDGKLYTTTGGTGGKGGNGGNGGPGGSGGGGGGGPSVGVWCSDGGVITTEGVTITEGLGPAGGGGPSAGNTGAPGQVIRYQGCVPSPP
ncbi:MAG: hypothetical protein JXB05_14590 [Myxococcaceae bacterium]|nr:hypothetical protein [Myxococcaceae bacterium]